MPVAAAPAAPHPPSAAPPTLSSLLPDLQQLLAGRRWSQAVLAARQHLAVAAAAAIAARDEGEAREGEVRECDATEAAAAPVRAGGGPEMLWPAAGLAAAAATRAMTNSSRRSHDAGRADSLVLAAEEAAAWRGLAVALVRGLESPEAAYTACCRGLHALAALQRRRQQPAAAAAAGEVEMAGWERELLTVRLECLSAVARGDSHAVRARLKRSGLLLLLPSVQAAAAAAAAATLMPERPASAAHATSLHRRQGLGQEQWQGQEQEEAEEAAAGGSPAARALPHPRVFALSDLHADAAISGGGGGGGGGGEPAAARRTTYMDLLRRVSLRHFQHDVLLVAGDVADTLPATREALRLLKQRFGRVFFTPGNHDLWLRPGLEDSCAGAGGAGNDSTSGSGLADSYAKLWALWDACDELGVEVVPAEVAPRVLVAPLLSWYRHTFDTADPVPGRLRFDSWCRWPVAEADVWQVMLRLNDVALAAIRTWREARRGSTTPAPPTPQPAANAAIAPAPPDTSAPAASALLPAAAAPAPANAMPPHRSHGTTADEACGSISTSTSISSTGDDPALPPLVITLTHFLPHPDLPFPRLPRELAKAVGCAELQHVLAMAGSSVHVYGHSHVAADTWLPTVSAAAGAAAADGAVAAGRKGGGGAAAAGGVGSSSGGAAGGGGGKAVVAGESRAAGGVGKRHGEAGDVGRDRTASRRYVHWPLHGQSRRAVLRCVWDPARGLCSYGMDGEDGSELS